MRRFRRGFLVRILLTITSLSLVCCLVAIFETVHEISSDHLLRAQGVNNHFSGFPSALASYNVENTGDEILPNLLSESLYREQGRGLKSFPKLKQWEEYQNSPLYNTTLSTGFLGCSEIKAIKVVGNIGRGYTKTVQKGLYRDVEVAIKSVRLDNEDIKRCVLHSTGNRTVDECFIFAKYKLAKEIIMLQQLRHANIVKLLGFCWQNELNTADLMTRGLTMVTEIGSMLDVITLVQLPWQERFRICLGLARLLRFLAHSPIGSLLIRDFKLSQFILVSGEIKLTDFDDVDNEEPECLTNKDCIVRGTKGNKTLQCDRGRCRGAIAAKNLDYASRGVISHILIPGAPKKLQSYLEEIKYNLQTLTWSSDELVRHLERVLDILRLGKHLESYTSATNFYKELPNSDFPKLHDYGCLNSRLFGACQLAVYDITEAKYKCDTDDQCKAFVTTAKTLWTGYFIVYLKNDTTRVQPNKDTTVYIKQSIHAKSNVSALP